ncbi:BEN domain-containing protein 6 isoform X1 [Meriones unguiculatus]|uniref:BEN domain-containing protein 6 isoform X1 n=1 Tax=Meriones unguiculatus TaxID=10047 RepID=UPI00293F11FF|nr:BEN domain-containing protein 6 isoform X1 [Meriones unguiculatus]XP_060225810.1 BEN domain-containing protein 6 isoform X1 [Meriones unguiculatus]XP_060225811.1 BEN domain-containing protein 6 isoform X1 [Meriones unguiculatus]
MKLRITTSLEKERGNGRRLPTQKMQIVWWIKYRLVFCCFDFIFLTSEAHNSQRCFQRDPYSGNAFLPGESSSEDETPLAELSKEELCTKVRNLRAKLTNTRKENGRLRQSLVTLQVLPQAVTQFEELVGMAETLLKGGGASSTPASTLWRATNNSSPDSFASLCSNSNSSSSSPSSLKAEEEPNPGEKQFKIEKWQIARCNKSKPQKFINDLMQVLYTNEYMATHSLTGAKSSTSRDKVVKPAMNQNEVQEIIGVTKQVFPSADDASVRRMIGQKLNNCTKKPNVSKAQLSGC